MRITSQAGDFVVDIQSMETEGDKLVMVGKMGWWDSKLYFGSAEMLAMLWLMLKKPAVLVFLVILPFRVLFRALTGRLDAEEDWVEPTLGDSPRGEDDEYAPD